MKIGPDGFSDLKSINHAATQLNAEAEDILEYQASLDCLFERGEHRSLNGDAEGK